MPPKRKAPKPKENDEIAAPPEKRTLRPRNAAAVKLPQSPPKSTKNNTKKTTKKKATKIVEEEKVEAPERKSKKKEEEVLNEIEEEEPELTTASSIYEFKADDIKGQEVSLAKYKGHVCVIVNVASRCGHTSSNYKEFVELYDKYGDEKGLRILAFPCNQFGKQEPGDNEKICEFANKKNVKFDMFAKIDVNGPNAHPLWNYLKSQKDGPKGENIDWNFTKFLINKEGQVVDRFKPSVKPLALVKELEKLW